MTPVGKIFKPALRLDAVQRVVESHLVPLNGIHPFSVAVSTAEASGTLVHIRLSGVPAQEQEAVLASIRRFYIQLSHRVLLKCHVRLL